MVNKCKNFGADEYCDNKDLKLARLKSKSYRGNEYKGDVVLICAKCRRGIENGQFKLIVKMQR